jgi:hypothetical protein
MDSNGLLLIGLVAVAGVALFAIAVPWRRMLRHAPRLPLWEFLRREGIARGDAADTINAQAMKQAELGCAVCGSRELCLVRLAAGGEAVPPANCPNAPLFRDFGIGVEKTRQ